MLRRWRNAALGAATMVVFSRLWAETLAVSAPQTPINVGAPIVGRLHFGDYDSELRGPDGRVDVEALAARLKQLGVTTYYWLVWHAPTDWEDLQLFLPQAAKAGIEVWVYLVPPSEGSGNAGPPSQPFGLDFLRWSEEISRLSLRHTNLTAWVIDDFYANRASLTPAYLKDCRARAKTLNPRLAFLPLMYFNELHPRFVEQYRAVIDGVVVAYLQDREEIERTWALLNDAIVPPSSEFVFPANTASQAGDYVLASQNATVRAGEHYVIRFRERDDFTGPTTGYHFTQLLVDGTVVWEEDVAGGTPGWRPVSVDASAAVRGKSDVTLAFRLLDKRGVSNFGVRWQVSELRMENLQVHADLASARDWEVSREGAFETGFGPPAKPGERRFHIPFISMSAGDAAEFRLRHGEPASPERIAAQLQLSLQAWQEGRCDGVVTYCLDKRPHSSTFPLVQNLFQEFRDKRRTVR